VEENYDEEEEEEKGGPHRGRPVVHPPPQLQTKVCGVVGGVFDKIADKPPLADRQSLSGALTRPFTHQPTMHGSSSPERSISISLPAWPLALNPTAQPHCT
jgi:hypothetical protein